MLVVFVYFLIPALARAEEQIWEDNTSHHYAQNDTNQMTWNRFVDWMLDFSRIDKLIENTDWEMIPDFDTTNDVVCHLGRVGHLSSIQRTGPVYFTENGYETGLKFTLTLGHLEFKFSNCTFWPQPDICPSWNGSKIDFFKPNGIFISNSVYIEIFWNIVEYPSRCNAKVEVLSVELDKVIMRNHTPLIHNECRISDEFLNQIVPEIRNSTIEIINVRLKSIIGQIANIVDVCSLYVKYGHISPFWDANKMFRGKSF